MTYSRCTVSGEAYSDHSPNYKLAWTSLVIGTLTRTIMEKGKKKWKPLNSRVSWKIINNTAILGDGQRLMMT